ncbi:MAG: hypothetical protein ACRD6I_13475, partial [Candidatus Acidiferrales bacterium]
MNQREPKFQIGQDNSVSVGRRSTFTAAFAVGVLAVSGGVAGSAGQPSHPGPGSDGGSPAGAVHAAASPATVLTAASATGSGAAPAGTGPVNRATDTVSITESGARLRLIGPNFFAPNIFAPRFAAPPDSGARDSALPPTAQLIGGGGAFLGLIGPGGLLIGNGLNALDLDGLCTA